MARSTLRFESTDGVATITLDRPERLNSFDTTMTAELQEVWRELRFADDVRAIVLTAPESGPSAPASTGAR